jgi:hypothetical protein
MCTPFMFDPAEYENVKRGWADLRAEVEAVRDRFPDLTALTSQPPAEDLATKGFMANARLAVEAARQSNALMHTYAGAFLAALERTASAYQEKDGENAQLIAEIG